MATFTYEARDEHGRAVHGRLAGSNEAAVLAELHARALSPIRVAEVRERTAMRKGVSLRQLATAYQQIADLLRAGVPLLRSLRLIGRSKASPRLAAVMRDVADQVADGERLADAMGAHPDVFPAIQLAMVRAGERGGFLEQVFERLSVFLEHQADTRGKVVGSLIYPLLLVTVGVGVVVFALVVFVPQFESMYANIELPTPTKILMAASEIVQVAWLPMLIAIGALIAGARWGLRQPPVRRAVAVVEMKIPKLGPLLQAMAVARFARILGTLLENGIPLIQSMQIAKEAAGNVLLEEAIAEATEAVRAGESLAEPLGVCGLLSEDVVEMIAVGESANNLDVVLITIADTIEARIERMLAIVLKLIEPMLLLAMAAAVLFIFVALIVPLLRMGMAV